jgi:hypothetical protein
MFDEVYRRNGSPEKVDRFSTKYMRRLTQATQSQPNVTQRGKGLSGF